MKIAYEICQALDRFKAKFWAVGEAADWILEVRKEN